MTGRVRYVGLRVSHVRASFSRSLKIAPWMDAPSQALGPPQLLLSQITVKF